MPFKSIFPFATLILAAAPAWADTVTPLTYEQFEAAVPHTDLETCPEALAQENVFCRATLRHEEIHVFAFHNEGENLFAGFKTYPADGLIDLLK